MGKHESNGINDFILKGYITGDITAKKKGDF